ncbi:MAG: ABC transporter ATP-binding protein [Eubacteriales bacterium]|nr:ABC transporter ATP-binding protein [Eubacteriales bacterium]
MKLLNRVAKILTKRQKGQLVVLFFLMLIGAGMETIGTGLILPVVTIAMSPSLVTTDATYSRIYEALHMSSPTAFLLLIIFLLIGLYVVKNVFLYFMYRAQYRFIYNGQFNTSRNLFKDYVTRPYEFFLDANTPVIMRHILSDVNGVYNMLLTMLSFATEGIIMAALITLSLIVSPFMTVVMGGLIAVILFVNKKIMGPVLRRYGQDVQVNSSLTTKWLLQAVSGMKETKVLNKEKYFVDQYEKSAEKLCEIQKKQNSYQNIPRLLIETVCMGGILAMVAVFLMTSDDPASTIGQIGVLAVVAIRIMPSANRISTYLNSIAYYEPCMDAVEGIILRSLNVDADAVFANRGPIRALPFEKEVRLENVTYRYPNTEVNILEKASLTIPLGKSIGIIGPSGAGKSTAVDVLLGLLQPQEGRITVDGTDIETNIMGWYANIGYVPQLMYMLDDTIRNNIAYGFHPEDIDDAQVWHVLKEAQMDEFVRSLPEGLDTSIGERGVRLSGGQRQRIGIARALYMDPEIMIFDEATSALDNDTEEAIMGAIERLHGRKTLVIIAHRLTTIEKCDAVYRVEDRRFVLDPQHGKKG